MNSMLWREQAGVEYHFTDRTSFGQQEKAGAFLEVAEYSGQCYEAAEYSGQCYVAAEYSGQCYEVAEYSILL